MTYPEKCQSPSTNQQRTIYLKIKSRCHFCSNLENGVIFLPIHKEQVKVKLSPCMPGTHIRVCRYSLTHINLDTTRRWALSCMPWPLYCQGQSIVSNEPKAGWATELVWMFWKTKNKKSLASTRSWNMIPWSSRS